MTATSARTQHRKDDNIFLPLACGHFPRASPCLRRFAGGGSTALEFDSVPLRGSRGYSSETAGDLNEIQKCAVSPQVRRDRVVSALCFAPAMKSRVAGRASGRANPPLFGSPRRQTPARRRDRPLIAGGDVTPDDSFAAASRGNPNDAGAEHSGRTRVAIIRAENCRMSWWLARRLARMNCPPLASRSNPGRYLKLRGHASCIEQSRLMKFASYPV
jgi:hypothetical protein